jgi:hypothetical protein
MAAMNGYVEDDRERVETVRRYVGCTCPFPEDCTCEAPGWDRWDNDGVFHFAVHGEATR